MRKVARGAVWAAFVIAAALDIGAYVRRDWQLEEPARDLTAGLGALAAAAAVGWAMAEPGEGAGDER